MKLYKVKDWASRYENNRTRDMKHMQWVPVPNSHDGDGYTDLVDRKNGAALLGAWLVILQVASKCDPRGTLLRDTKKPHDAASISRMTKLPREIIEEALVVLCSDIQWLEVVEVAQIPQESAEKPQEGAEIPHPTDEERKGMEWKGTEESGTRTRSPDESFAEIPSWEEFWTYCQSPHCSLVAEWFARDKYEAANADNWRKNSNWRAYARRCKGWWESDGRPMERPTRKPLNGKPDMSAEKRAEILLKKML